MSDIVSQKRMNVTFVLPELPDRPTGGARVVYEYANGLAARGHRVTVLHPRTLLFAGLKSGLLHTLKAKIAGLPDLALRGDWGVHPAPVAWQTLHPSVRSLSIPTLWARYIPDGDVIIATFWRTADYVATSPRRCGEKFYFLQHYEVTMGPEKRVDATWRLPLHKIVIARWLLDVGRRLGIAPESLQHVPNAIDHDRFYLMRPLEGRPLRVAMLYSPLPWKGSAEGIAALEIARRAVPSLQAVLFGTGPRPSGLPEWMEYHENPSPDVLRDTVYNGSAIYLCSSWSEGWGLPVTEAMACGCAIVTTDNGGISDFVLPDATGLIVPPKDVEGMARALIRLLSDTALRERFATAGRTHALTFTYARSLDLFEKALERFVHPLPSPPAPPSKEQI